MENSDLTIPPESKPENPLNRAIIANQDGVITSARCHICRSKFRNQIEGMFEQNTHVSVIKKFLSDNGEEYTIGRLKHHFESHFKNMQTQAAIAEYRDHLDEMMKRRRSMVDDMLCSIDIAWIEIANVLVIPTGDDMDKKQKKERMIADLLKAIKDGHEFIKSLHDGEAKARALEEKFELVWKIKLDAAKDETERKFLISTLKDFQDKLNQM